MPALGAAIATLAIAFVVRSLGRDWDRISEAFSVVGVPEASVDHVIETMQSTTMRGKRAAGFLTFALDPGKSLDKLDRVSRKS